MPTIDNSGRSDGQLRDARAALFDQFEAIASVQDIFAFQMALVREIKAAELVIAHDKTSPEFDHRHLVRLFGDALAWTLLHPYAIRHLYNQSAPPPSIGNQRGFDETIEAAREQCDRGVPAIIADLTNCLGTADVIAVTHPERPMLIECGGHPKFVGKGRKARQMRRALATATLLHKGEARCSPCWAQSGRMTANRPLPPRTGRIGFTASTRSRTLTGWQALSTASRAPAPS